MLLVKSFKDYEGFKEVFGIVEHGNGETSRKNKILLSLYKSREIWKLAEKYKNFYPFAISDMAHLKEWVMTNLSAYSIKNGGYSFDLLGQNFYSQTYELDRLSGVCSDGDFRAIRYIKHEEGRDDHIYKMKAGKFLGKLIDENEFGNVLPIQVKTWVCEEFAAEWSAYSRSKFDGYSLHTGSEPSDFEGIYGSFKSKGTFGSCMMNSGQSDFYPNSTDSMAAWLTDANDYMVARCVVFNNVREVGSDKIWRLAERQYSSNGDETLKRLLVLKLIEAGLIDGYKQIGAGCRSTRLFVDNDGKSLSNKMFQIECNLEDGDVLSFQDSFKRYDLDSHTAANYDDFGEYDLDITNCRFRAHDGREYDEYHETYVNRVVNVYYQGDYITCDEEDLEDFRWVEREGEYYHEDEVVWDRRNDEYLLEGDACYCKWEDDWHYADNCVLLHDGYYAHEDDVAYVDGRAFLEEEVGCCDYCGRNFVTEYEYYSDLTGESYCCEDCMIEAERVYREEHDLVEAED